MGQLKTPAHFRSLEVPDAELALECRGPTETVVLAPERGPSPLKVIWSMIRRRTGSLRDLALVLAFPVLAAPAIIFDRTVGDVRWEHRMVGPALCLWGVEFIAATVAGAFGNWALALGFIAPTIGFSLGLVGSLLFKLGLGVQTEYRAERARLLEGRAE